MKGVFYTHDICIVLNNLLIILLILLFSFDISLAQTTTHDDLKSKIGERENQIKQLEEEIKKYNAEYNMIEGGNKPPSQKGNTWKLSEEAKEKLRKPKPPRTPEHTEKIASQLRGRKQPEDLVKKRTEANVNPHRPYGNTNRAKKYVVTYPDGSEQVVFNIAEWARENNLTKSSICQVCKGVREHTKGFRFRYQ